MPNDLEVRRGGEMTTVIEHNDYAPQEYTPTDDYREMVASEPETYLDTSSNGDSDLVPFKFWDKKSKAVFRQAPIAVKKAWTKMQRRADARAYQVVEELKKTYAVFDELSEVLLPYVESIEATGMTIPEYIDLTIKADAELTKNPIEFICALMDRFDIYPSQIDANFQGFYVRKAQREQMAPIHKEISQLKVAQAKKELAAEQQRYDDMVYEFFSQEDSRGELVYPYAQELAPLMQTIVESTGQTDLDTVYRMAYSAAVEEAAAEEQGSREGEFAIDRNRGGQVRDDLPADSIDAKARRKDSIMRSLQNAMARYGVQS
jgi:hypothetical protein